MARGVAPRADELAAACRSCPATWTSSAPSTIRCSECSQVRTNGLPGRRLALRDLVLVVREDDVHAAAVDVEGLAQVLHAHRRALDVPARPARAPGRVPRRLARLGALPEDEVAHVLLAVLVAGHALAAAAPARGRSRRACRSRRRRRCGSRPSRRSRRRSRVSSSRSMSAIISGDVVGRPRVVLDPLDVQRVEVARRSVDERRRVVVQRDAGLVRAADGLVVHVGEVHHLGHAVAEVAQAAPQQVLEEEGAQVADVDVVVDRRAAGVDPQASPGIERRQRLEPPAEGVEETRLPASSASRKSAPAPALVLADHGHRARAPGHLLRRAVGAERAVLLKVKSPLPASVASRLEAQQHAAAIGAGNLAQPADADHQVAGRRLRHLRRHLHVAGSEECARARGAIAQHAPGGSRGRRRRRTARSPARRAPRAPGSRRCSSWPARARCRSRSRCW